jgi:hypothetical protein
MFIIGYKLIFGFFHVSFLRGHKKLSIKRYVPCLVLLSLSPIYHNHRHSPCFLIALILPSPLLSFPLSLLPFPFSQQYPFCPAIYLCIRKVYKKPFFQKVLKALPKKYYTSYTINNLTEIKWYRGKGFCQR